MVHIFGTGGESGPVGDCPGATSTHNKGLLHDRWGYYNLMCYKTEYSNINNNIICIILFSLFSFFTDSISRASQTMAKCVKAASEEKYVDELSIC